MEQNTNEKVYRIGGKEYTLAKEVVLGGCQGCAFYNRLDCHKVIPGLGISRSTICNKEHKVFKRLINHK